MSNNNFEQLNYANSNPLVLAMASWGKTIILSHINEIHYEMRVKGFSGVAEFVVLFCASGL